MSVTESPLKESLSKQSSSKAPSLKEQRIRELAYQIWETEGCPDGQAHRHWELANKLAEVEARDDPRPAKRARSVPKPHDAAADITLPPATRSSRAATPNQQLPTSKKTSAPKTGAPKQDT